MAHPSNTLATMLKEHGYSVTKPRLAVFEQLLGQEPLSMHTLVDRVQTVDRASVYRTVALFEELGIVIRINIGWKYKLELSERFAEHHHHLSCIRCGQTVPINEQSLERMIEQLSSDYRFKPTAHQIEIQGLCAHCQAAEGFRQEQNN